MLLKNRHNLVEAGVTEGEWREEWEAKRYNTAFTFAGESGKPGGNETLRINPLGQIELRLPNSLTNSKLGDGKGRYIFENPVSFTYLQQEWQRVHESKESIQYQIIHDPVKGRWYLEATFKPSPVKLLRNQKGINRHW